MRRFVPPLLLGALGILSAACSSAPSSQSADPAAARLLGQVQAAVQKASSVTFSDITTVNNQSQTIAGSFSAVASTEDLAGAKGAYVRVRVLGTSVWVQTNSTSSLTQALGLSESAASKAVDSWIQLSSTDGPYNQLLQSMTIAQTVDVYFPTRSSVHLGTTTTINGIKVRTLTGSVSASSGPTATTSLLVDATTLLPVRGVLNAHQGGARETKRCDYSAWGAKVAVEAPSSAAPLSSFTG